MRNFLRLIAPASLSMAMLSMAMLLMAMLLMATLSTGSWAQTTDQIADTETSYLLQVSVNDQTVSWQAVAPASRVGDTLRVLTGSERAVVTFAGGRLELNLADVNQWHYAHVLGTRWQQTDANTYTVHATVRHADDGWDNYANVFQVTPANDDSHVNNGVRELLHPHDNEQPFTRSQRGVQARGQVRIEAADNVDGWGGSAIELALTDVTFPLQVRWQLELTNP